MGSELNQSFAAEEELCCQGALSTPQGFVNYPQTGQLALRL